MASFLRITSISPITLITWARNQRRKTSLCIVWSWTSTKERRYRGTSLAMRCWIDFKNFLGWSSEFMKIISRAIMSKHQNRHIYSLLRLWCCFSWKLRMIDSQKCLKRSLTRILLSIRIINTTLCWLGCSRTTKGLQLIRLSKSLEGAWKSKRS